MCCKIYCVVVGLLLSAGAVFPQAHTGPRPLLRPRVKVVNLRWFAPAPPLFLSYCCPVSFPYPVLDPVPYPAWNYIAPAPAYVFVGSASPSHPQLVFKDGTTYTVADYWRANDQLHFITIEEGGTKSVPHAVPLADLDVQRTSNTNAAQGFRFVLRDEPIEQWLEHHRQDAPRRHGGDRAG